MIPAWLDCAGLSTELRCWRLQIGNLSVDTDGRLWRRRAPTSGVSQLIVPSRERQEMNRRFHDSLFAGHLLAGDVGRGCVTTFVLTWHPVLFVWHASPHANEGLPWDMLTWDTDGIELQWTFWTLSVTTAKGNQYVLVMVDCFSRWTESCPLANKTAYCVPLRNATRDTFGSGPGVREQSHAGAVYYVWFT